jgi:hypothetical protein
MKLQIMPFHPASCHILHLRPKYLSEQPIFKTLSLCCSLNVIDQVSHSYKITRKIKILYILIFKFFYTKREDHSFWTERQQVLPEFNHLSISSREQIWFVSVAPNNSKSVIFSENLLSKFVQRFVLRSVQKHYHVLNFISGIFRTFVEKIQVSLQSNKNNG